MTKKLSPKLSSSLTAIKNRKSDTVLLNKIKAGLSNNEFKMHIQFIVDSKTKKLVLSEALSRWETVEDGVILPGKYIGLMEKSGLIIDFDYYMFEKVCQKLSEWVGTEFKDVFVACNFTRITISENDFADKIKEIADKYEFDRSKLIMEITEDTIERNLGVAKNNIKKVKELGFCIALDDIGTGCTSFISLCEYPVDIVKLDREVLLLTQREMGKKLFLGVISLLHSLNLKVVCEGVETEEQNVLACESECDYIQGWYYTKALPEDRAEEFAREYARKF